MAIPSYLPQQATLKACWLLDEASGNRADQSAGVHTAVDVNTVLSAIMPKRVGLAADFEISNSEYLNPDEHADFNLANSDYSICCLVNLESLVARNIILSNQKASSQFEGWYFYINTSGYLSIYHGIWTGNPATSSWIGVDNTTPLLASITYHVGVTFDWIGDGNSSYKFYVNGLNVYSNTNGKVIAQNTSVTNIGALDDSASFDGLMQRLYFWKGTVLTAAEMLGIYSAEKIKSGGFSGFSPWIFMKDMWEKHNKLWTPKGLVLPKDLGFQI